MLSYDRIVKLKDSFSNIPLIALVAANTIPLVGVLFLDWEAFLVVLLYWAENLAIGFYNILKIAFSSVPHATKHAGKLFAIPFFMIHYGGFMAVHGIFVLALFKQEPGSLFPSGNTWPCFFVFLQLLFNVIGTMLAILPPNMLYAIGGLFISHGISFAYNYLYQGEYRTKTVKVLMGEPYARIVVMHIAIIAGGFLTMSLGSPIGVLVMLVILKMIFDVKLHLREHREKGKA